MSPQTDNERLFLLEVLIDNVQFDNETILKYSNNILKETYVRFKIINVLDFDVCNEDIRDGSLKADYPLNNATFKSGKSVLFSLRQSPLDVSNMNINVCVSRKRENRNVVFIGRAVVPLGNCFRNILLAKQEECSYGPRTKTIKETYSLLNITGSFVGNITIFIRLSCFGNIIVTQFEAEREPSKSFNFKGATHQLSRTSRYPQTALKQALPKTASPCLNSRGWEKPYGKLNVHMGDTMDHSTSANAEQLVVKTSFSTQTDVNPSATTETVAYGRFESSLGMNPTGFFDMAQQMHFSGMENPMAEIVYPMELGGVPGLMTPMTDIFPFAMFPPDYKEPRPTPRQRYSWKRNSTKVPSRKGYLSTSEEDEYTQIQAQFQGINLNPLNVTSSPGSSKPPSRSRQSKKKKKKAKIKKCPFCMEKIS